MDKLRREAQQEGKHISYFGEEANDFGALAELFKSYGETGNGKVRRYLHTFDDAVPYNQLPGTFTPYQALDNDTDMLFYEGLHGGVVTPEHDVASHVDLLIGMVPIINLSGSKIDPRYQ